MQVPIVAVPEEEAIADALVPRVLFPVPAQQLQDAGLTPNPNPNPISNPNSNPDLTPNPKVCPAQQPWRALRLASSKPW